MIDIFEGVKLSIERNSLIVDEIFILKENKNGIDIIANYFYLEMNLYYCSYLIQIQISNKYLNSIRDYKLADKKIELVHNTKIRKILHDITNADVTTPIGYFQIHYLTLKLITEFRISENQSSHGSNNNILNEKLTESIKAYIDKNLLNQFSLDDIASHIGINKTYVKKWFKLKFNKTISDYILGERMSLARILIEEKRISIAEVASIIGYSNTSNFSNAFKKFYTFRPIDIKK